MLIDVFIMQLTVKALCLLIYLLYNLLLRLYAYWSLITPSLLSDNFKYVTLHNDSILYHVITMGSRVVCDRLQLTLHFIVTILNFIFSNPIHDFRMLTFAVLYINDLCKMIYVFDDGWSELQYSPLNKIAGKMDLYWYISRKFHLLKTSPKTIFRFSKSYQCLHE